MILYAGALDDGAAEARRCESTPNPARAVSLVAEYRQRVREVFPGMSDLDVETVVLRALYGHMTPGEA